jgi:hypothetical protein
MHTVGHTPCADGADTGYHFAHQLFRIKRKDSLAGAPWNRGAIARVAVLFLA